MNSQSINEIKRPRRTNISGVQFSKGRQTFIVGELQLEDVYPLLFLQLHY